MPWAGVMFLGNLRANKVEVHRQLAATGTGILLLSTWLVSYFVEYLCVLS
jgi:DNA-binding transcriptional LysR family regulator